MHREPVNFSIILNTEFGPSSQFPSQPLTGVSSGAGQRVFADEVIAELPILIHIQSLRDKDLRGTRNACADRDANLFAG
jgi:hypothetical protein